MEKAQTARLLAVAAVVDNRRVEPATVEAWHEVLGHLDYGACRRALAEHRRSSTAYLQPAHIVALVDQERDEVAVLEAETRRLQEAWLGGVMGVEEFRALAASEGVSAACRVVESRKEIEG